MRGLRTAKMSPPELDLRTLAASLYPGPSGVVHRAPNKRRLEEYLERISSAEATIREPTARDLSLLAILEKKANEDGSFDPVTMNLDIEAVRRAAEFGFLTVKDGIATVTHKGRMRTLGTNDVKTTPGEKEEIDKTFQLIEQRRNQGPFRKSLLKIFDYKCGVTGCEITDVLEAAHIVPYAEGSPNRDAMENGLLLRADIHILFDLHLISIFPGGGQRRLFVSDKLKYIPPYNDLQGRHVRTGYSSEENLRTHWDRSHIIWANHHAY